MWQSAKNMWQRIHRQRNLYHLPSGKQSAKSLPPVSMAVDKGDVRRCEMTERIPFANYHAAVGKGFSYFFYNRISLPIVLMDRWQRLF